LENLDAEVHINRVLETIRENIKSSAKESLGYYKLKKHMPWFDENETSQTAVLTDPSEINGDNLNTIRREASRHFRNKKREYLKNKINKLALNSKNKNKLCKI
jgi:hypothetical protein